MIALLVAFVLSGLERPPSSVLAVEEGVFPLRLFRHDFRVRMIRHLPRPPIRHDVRTRPNRLEPFVPFIVVILKLGV